jgi:hypothetical protein
LKHYETISSIRRIGRLYVNIGQTASKEKIVKNPDCYFYSKHVMRKLQEKD